MRHLKSGRKLNRTASHRKAMLSNLATSILDKERVTTTVEKAKEVRSSVERLITYGKKNSLHAIRLVAKKVKDKSVIKKLFEDIAPGYKDREGGYTRIIKKGVRHGDCAEMAIIELVGRVGDVQRKRKKKKKVTNKKPVQVKKDSLSTKNKNENIVSDTEKMGKLNDDSKESEKSTQKSETPSTVLDGKKEKHKETEDAVINEQEDKKSDQS